MCTSKIDLECRCEPVGADAVLFVSGEIDLASWKPFGLAVHRALAESAAVIVDLGRVRHFDACGARALRTAHQLRPDARLTVRNAPHMARVVLDLVGMSTILVDEDCAGAALDDDRVAELVAIGLDLRDGEPVPAVGFDAGHLAASRGAW